MPAPIDLTTGDDGETRRRFFLLAEVSFAGEYYDESELEGQFTDWVAAALEDRDDQPQAKFRPVPAAMERDVRAVAAGTYPGNADALANLNRRVAVMASWAGADPERAMSQERALYLTALKMIRDGAGDPPALAEAALAASAIRFRY